MFDQVMVNLGLLFKHILQGQIFKWDIQTQQPNATNQVPRSLTFRFQKYLSVLPYMGKVGLCQPRIIICENLVEPKFLMLHTMSQTIGLLISEMIS